jgi:tRNA(fMet)-specific endonuclease VapC
VSTLLLDTNIVSYLIKNHSLAERYRPTLAGHILAISFMTVAELYEGAFRANWGDKKRRLLEAALRAYLVIPSSAGVCRRWGEVRAGRRRQPISAQDAWIAATALEYNCSLVTHDRDDFSDIASLSVLSAP